MYGLGQQLYESRKEFAVGHDALQGKKAYLRELDQLTDQLSARAVAELEGLGVNSSDDLLAKQGLVKEKLRAAQGQMEKELGGR